MGDCRGDLGLVLVKREKVFFKSHSGKNIGGILHIPEGKEPFPAIVFVHGFGGGVHEKKNIHMCNELAKKGFVSLMFDFYNKPNKISEQKNEDMTISQQVRDISCAIDFVLSLNS